ncbi:MAG: hypothetical protein E4G95_02280 [Bacteroidia bacterium]|nr:MAG: hypothetical protein E4G95_02280 [Bacteroidia bacterium]
MGKRVTLNSFIAGFAAGIVLPVVIFLILWLITAGDLSFSGYVDRMVAGQLLANFISICVFPNVLTFLLFNRLDWLESSKGVLGITIIWALLTFIIKFSV